MKRRKNKYKKKYGHIEGEIESRDENPFNALREKDEPVDNKKKIDKGEDQGDKKVESARNGLQMAFTRQHLNSKM